MTSEFEISDYKINVNKLFELGDLNRQELTVDISIYRPLLTLKEVNEI